MKKFFAVATAMCAIGFAVAADATELNFANPYIGLAGTVSHSYEFSSGYNTAGGFNNTGDSSANSAGVDIQAGFNKLIQFTPNTSLRAEAEFDWRKSQNFMTDSSTPGDISFFYQAHTRSVGGFVNSYVDEALPGFTPFGADHPVSVFVGGGIGAFDNTADVDDTVVHGSGSNLAFAYQTGAGGKIALGHGLDLVLGLRYMDLGRSEVTLVNTTSALNRGDYILDNHVVEGTVGITLSF